ncbi:hypothetical protein FQA39_LY05769 [Lamprigera yunnana]|nr:hypothetical protein FQA39_LY05769 [Lamprigera yunnana]
MFHDLVRTIENNRVAGKQKFLDLATQRQGPDKEILKQNSQVMPDLSNAVEDFNGEVTDNQEDKVVISDEEIVTNWNIKASRKITVKLTVFQNIKVLDEVLREYVLVLHRQAVNFKMKQLLRDKILTHVKVFHLCCTSADILPVELEGYWESMEKVLIVLMNLELDLVRQMSKDDNAGFYRKRIVEITTKLIYTLSVFLLNNDTRICHVLLKINTRYDSQPWKDVMRVVYRHFLLMVPVKDKTMENFCRNFLLFQYYKSLLTGDRHPKIDIMLFERFSMSPDLIHNSKRLKRMLMPPAYLTCSMSVMDMVTNHGSAAVQNYFLHIKKTTEDQDNLIPLSINLESDSEDELLEFPLNSSSGRRIQRRIRSSTIEEIKVEEIEMPTTNYKKGHVICLDDDDSDVEEVLLPIVSRSTITIESSEIRQVRASFLDSIDISDEEFDEPSSPVPEESVKACTSDHLLSTSETTTNVIPFLDVYLQKLRECEDNECNSSTSDNDECNSHTPENVEANVAIATANLSIQDSIAEKTISDIESIENGIVAVVEETSQVTNNLSIIQQLEPTEISDKMQVESAAAEVIQPEYLKSSERSPTSCENFNFISGLITPPVSDRTSDDIVPDLNQVSNGRKNVYIPNMISMDDIGYQFESEMESLMNNSDVMVDNLLVSDKSHNDNAAVEEQTKCQDDINLSIDHVVESETDEYNVASIGNLLEIERTDSNIDCTGNEDINVETIEEYGTSDNLTPVDMVLEDYHLPISEIKENILSILPVPHVSHSDISSMNVVEKEPTIVESINENILSNVSTSSSISTNDIIVTSNNPYTENVTKIQASVPIINEAIKLNGDTVKLAKPRTSAITFNSDKVIFTSSERVSAPLSVFSKFEQAQSELVENAFSGPLEPLYNYAKLNLEHSNSNDGLNFSSKYTISKQKVSRVSNLDEGSLTAARYSIPQQEVLRTDTSEHTNLRDDLHSTFKYSRQQISRAASSEHSNLGDTVHSKLQYCRQQQKVSKSSALQFNSDNSLHSSSKFPRLHEKNLRIRTLPSSVCSSHEPIQIPEYKNNIMRVDYDHLMKTISSPICKMPKTVPIGERSDHQEHKHTSSRKRKMDININRHKKGKVVKFGGTKIMIIPPKEESRLDPKLLEDQVLREAKDSMKEYQIHGNDVKLVYLQPQIPIKVESVNQLVEKERQLKFRGFLHSAEGLHSDKSCIVKRIDYKKNIKQVKNSIPITKNCLIGHKISNLINIPPEDIRIDSIPSGYVPPLHGYATVHGHQSSNTMEQQQTFNNHQQKQSSNTLNDNCNSEILNLSVSSKLISELDSPESEFSRSPKLLQNSDQIVQECLSDNLDNTEIESSNSHNNLSLLSNHSNFYSASHPTPSAVLPQLSPLTEGFSCQQLLPKDDEYKKELEELLLNNEIYKLTSCDSESSLPLKKRRVFPKLKNAMPTYKEELSYPATPMISIAELESLDQSTCKNRSFKTPAERKELPPSPFVYNKNSLKPTPIITDQFNINNHTYNNPTINYHMNNVPLPFLNVPCSPYYSFPPFLLPFNNVTNNSNINQDPPIFKMEEESQRVVKTENVKKQKKDKKKQSAKQKNVFEHTG